MLGEAVYIFGAVGASLRTHRLCLRPWRWETVCTDGKGDPLAAEY